jgi:hypothetical protein
VDRLFLNTREGKIMNDAEGRTLTEETGKFEAKFGTIGRLYR